MLDKQDTATLLRKRLTDAFETWTSVDPRKRTKAELARSIEALTDRKCTPQTVNAWFKTGRMDKSWLSAVEFVLGTSLGFAAPAVAPAAPQEAAWPFRLISYQKLQGLGIEDALRLEGVIIDAASRLNIDITNMPHSGDRKAA